MTDADGLPAQNLNSGSITVVKSIYRDVSVCILLDSLGWKLVPRAYDCNFGNGIQFRSNHNSGFWIDVTSRDT